jgi:hypothetical protein
MIWVVQAALVGRAAYECPLGIVAREKETPPKTLVQEVAAKKPGVRVFVVHSEERAAFECGQRTKAMERVLPFRSAHSRAHREAIFKLPSHQKERTEKQKNIKKKHARNPSFFASGTPRSKKAAIAVAASILTAVYHILKNHVPYQDLGPDSLRSGQSKCVVAL